MRLMLSLPFPFLLCAVLAPAQDAKDDKPTGGVIVQFNGKPVDGVEANTKIKEFKPVFEKELLRLADKIDGKPELKLSHWYTVINGCAVRCIKGNEKAFQQLKASLEKLPYVKTVEYDRPIKLDVPK